MMAQRHGQRTAVATVGFAADETGRGVVYAKIWSTVGAKPDSILRLGFRAATHPALRGRDVAYAAVEAIARELVTGFERVELRVADESLATDLAERRAVPADLQLPYIALRCTLNRFASCVVLACDDGTARDLTARARAEVSLAHAA